MFKETIKIFSLLLSQRGMSIVFRLVQLKVATSILGPSGMGVWSQITTVLDTFKQTILLGMGPGIVKLVAEFDGKGLKARIPSIITTAILFSFGIALTSATILMFNMDRLSGWLFGASGNITYLYIAFCAGVFAALTQLVILLLQGLKMWRTLFLSTICGLLVSSSVIIPSIYFGGLKYGVWGILFSAVLCFIITVLISASQIKELIRGAISISPEWKHARSLAEVAGIMSLVQIGGALCIVGLRAILLYRSGVIEVGYFHVSWVATEMLFGTFKGVIWAHGMPSIASRIDDSKFIESIQNNAQFLAFMVLTPVSIILLTTTEIWIPLVSSPEYLIITPVLGILFFGKLLEVFRQCLNTRLIPFRRYRFYILQALVLWITVAVVFHCFQHLGGAIALAVGFMSAHFITTVLAIVYHYRVFHHVIEVRVIKLAFASFFTLFVAVADLLFYSGDYYYVSWLMLLLNLSIVLSDSGVRDALGGILMKIKRSLLNE